MEEQSQSKANDDTTSDKDFWEKVKVKDSSAYLWHGFSGDLEIRTFDLFTKINIVSMSLGDNHSLFLSDDGQVFVSGMNNFGQLGLGSLEITSTDEPIKLHGISDLVTQVACGRDHSAIVVDTGQVFCWGQSKDGQCGTGSLDLVLSPTQVVVEILKGFCQHGVPKPTIVVAIHNVACGDSHTLAVSNDGEVWAWGCGPQLGLDDLKHAPVPRRIDFLQDHYILAVCCGDKHSLALVLREESSAARSMSLLKNKGKTEAKSVLENELYPSRCSICNKEIYTYTDTNDMCVIDTLHDCNVNDSIMSVDSTIVEEVSSSSSSEAIKRSATSSPNERDSLLKIQPSHNGEVSANDKSKKVYDNKNVDHVNQDNAIGDSSLLETSALDSSILVFLAEGLFEGEDSKTGEDSNSIAVNARQDKSYTLHEVSEDRLKQDESRENQDLSLTHTLKNEHKTTAEDIVVSDDMQLDKLSETDDNDEELKMLRQKNKSRSHSTTSVKSFDISGAREYLQRQFQDERASVLAISSGLSEVSSKEKSTQNEVSSNSKTTEDKKSQVNDKEKSSRQQYAHSHVGTATDVWVWGCNDSGQLGLGDQLDRSQPTIVKVFAGRHVIKLAAGQKHNLALTANSQVYSWGSNSYGQLGLVETFHVPTRIKFQNSFMVWDIAAGVAHSIFLGDAADMHPDICYSGKHPCKGVHKSLTKTNVPVSLVDFRKLGWITKVMAGGTSCSCKVFKPTPPETEALFELAATERAFYNVLIKTSNILLRPLQKSGFYNSMGVYPFKNALRNMINMFGALTKKVGEGITDLTRCIQNSNALNSIILTSQRQFSGAFQSYSQSFSDFLAVGGFDYCTRTGSEFFDKVQSSVQDLSEERDKTVSSSNLFLRAMRYPFCRLIEYSRIISKIAPAVTDENIKTQLHNLVLEWEGLKVKVSTEHKTAEATRVFWESAIVKQSDSLRTPDRRMLRESKTHQLLMPSGGRFTSRLFALFNDVFLMQTTNSMNLYPLETLWVESGTSEGDNQNAITIIAPEERLDVVASTPTEKAEWLISLNSAISKVLSSKKSLPCLHSTGERFTPPLIRHASYTFVKPGIYKEATYTGSWLSGKMDGIGILRWKDGSFFDGKFKKGLIHGSGTYNLVRPTGIELQKGHWKDGKLNGLATVKYANGDIYEGYFQDGQRFGHGKYQSGCHKSSCVSVYVGEWLANLREGYGVQDDILKGEKYMGQWSEDQRHGCGVMVTLDGMYFEGNFVQNKLMGFGVMISDDNTIYEGEFMDITHLAGKGTLTLSSGDKLEGSFSGTLNEGLKINGTFVKSTSSPDFDQKSHPSGVKSKHFSNLGVSADKKWNDVFSHTMATLGHDHLMKGTNQEDVDKAWEAVAVMVTAGRHTLKEGTGISPSKLKGQQKTLEDLEKIPAHVEHPLTTEVVEEMAAYLSKACDTIYHPLGQLMENLVDVFRASYIGIGAHPHLLHHAVLEMKSFISRLYQVVRILFPRFPVNGGPLYVYPASKEKDIPRTTEEARQLILGQDIEDQNVHIFTAAGLLYPIMLPKIYPPLFDLYALYNEKNDDRYWERVSKLNRQSDMGLMAYLGIEQQFWLVEDILQQDKTQKLSTIKDVCYAEAVDTLQQLSTAFSPIEKLKTIEQTFNEITKTVALTLKDDHMWCMDDLFPIFQFVVVRAKIRHLCAEIHMIDDLMEPYMEHGELGLMFTTLKACYFQIQNEKLPHH